MQNFLIKIGKAINVLRRDGLLAGTSRIFKAFLSQFKRVDSGDVLFVTGGVGDSAMYRSWNVAEELDLNGISSSVAYADNPFLMKYADSFKVFVFHRVAYTKKIARFVEKIKQLKREIIFDTDDLLYDPEFIKNADYFKNINTLEKGLYEKGLGAEMINDEYVKVCTTTTSFLANKLKEKGKRVFLVSNKLSKKDIEITNAINKRPKPEKESIVRIGYFSGTLSHNRDFATIIEALVKIMGKHQNVELLLAGPLDFGSALDGFRDRIRQLPYVQRESHFKNMASVDINIVPLVLDDPYCEAKSELKFFEAGIVGVPTVAIANRTFSEAISDGFDGLLARNTDEWVEKLEKLIREPNLRLEMGERAMKKALARYTTRNGKNPEYYAYLKEKINSLS